MASGDGFQYNPDDYPRFAVTVDIAVFTIRDGALQVLLVQRGQEPYLGAWALPGGFVRPDEDLDQAAERELAEETGLRPGSWHVEQLASFGDPQRDPRMRVVTVAYWAICAELPEPRGGGDALKAALTPVEHVERGAVRLAFDHERIVRDAVERTRSKLEYTALAARFCPPQFTIGQLRRVYETVWNRRLDPGNFQRGVQESGAFEKWAGAPAAQAPRRGRPAALWSLSTVGGVAGVAPSPLLRPLARRWRAVREAVAAAMPAAPATADEAAPAAPLPDAAPAAAEPAYFPEAEADAPEDVAPREPAAQASAAEAAAEHSADQEEDKKPKAVRRRASARRARTPRRR